MISSISFTNVKCLWALEERDQIRRPENHSEGDKVQSICPAIGFPELNISLPLRRKTVINSCSHTASLSLSLFVSVFTTFYHYMDTECITKPINIQTHKRVQDEVPFKALVYERMWRLSSIE